MGADHSARSRARTAEKWSDFEDALLELIVELFDQMSASSQFQWVSSFDLKAAIWDVPTSQSLSDDQLLCLWYGLKSLEARGHIEGRFMSGGMMSAKPTALAREFVAEPYHAEWLQAFGLGKRLPPDRAAFLSATHDLSLRRTGGVIRLTKVNEFDVMVRLGGVSSEDASRYHPGMRADPIRRIEDLEDAGFLTAIKMAGPFQLTPTYAACVLIEQGKPTVVYPDVVAPLSLALSEDDAFGGAVRLLAKADEEARRNPYADAENAIKDANAAAESAAEGITGKAGDLEEQLRMLARRGVIGPQVQRIGNALFQFRSSVPGVAHGGEAMPLVGVPEAMLAVQLAAALVSYLAVAARRTGR